MVDFTPGFNLGISHGPIASAPGVAQINPNRVTTVVGHNADGTPFGYNAGGDLVGKEAAPAASGTPAPAGGSAGPVLDTAAVGNTQKAIAEIAPLLQAALTSEGHQYTNATGALDAQQASQQKTYDASTTTNQQNYDSNFMASILAGIHGLGGLINILRGSGAAGGTAEDQARDAVGSATAGDIRSGADTQKSNQTTLDSDFSSFLTDLKSKKAAADDTHVNNVAAINRDSATQLQDLYGKLAGYYGDAGDTADATKYSSEAGDLTPKIAANSKSQTSVYDTTPVPVSAPQLTAFSAPSQPNAIAAPTNGQVGSGIFTISKRKSQTPVAAGV